MVRKSAVKKNPVRFIQLSAILFIGMALLVPGGKQSSLQPAAAVTTSVTSPSPYGKILYRGYKTGGIAVMDADGSNKINLTDGDKTQQFPSWSPDGKRVVFQLRGNQPRQIYIMDADGAHQTKLTDGPQDEEPTFSPDGKKILFARGDFSFNFALYTMDVDGSNVAPVGYVSGSMENWSPDGNQIVYSEVTSDHFQIFVVNADGSHERQLTDTQMDNNEPVWSPDGKHIAYAVGNSHDKKQIYVMDADGSNPVDLSNNQFLDGEPTWSPDGNFIAYTSERGKSASYICMMNADGSNQHPITSEGDDSQPSWSGPNAVFPGMGAATAVPTAAAP